jgi:hypothetical protein
MTLLTFLTFILDQLGTMFHINIAWCARSIHHIVMCLINLTNYTGSIWYNVPDQSGAFFWSAGSVWKCEPDRSTMYPIDLALQIKMLDRSNTMFQIDTELYFEVLDQSVTLCQSSSCHKLLLGDSSLICESHVTWETGETRNLLTSHSQIIGLLSDKNVKNSICYPCFLPGHGEVEIPVCPLTWGILQLCQCLATFLPAA